MLAAQFMKDWLVYNFCAVLCKFLYKGLYLGLRPIFVALGPSLRMRVGTHLHSTSTSSWWGYARTQNYTAASCFRGKSVKEATAGKTGTQHTRKIGCSDSPEEFIWEPQPGVPAAVWQICSRQYQGKSVVEFATYMYFYCDWDLNACLKHMTHGCKESGI